jgi:Mg2+/Co2+ transporter CorB
VLIPESGAPLLGVVALSGAVGVPVVVGAVTVVVVVFCVVAGACVVVSLEPSLSEPQAPSVSAVARATIAAIRLMTQ